MKDGRLSLYSLLLFIFAYMVTITLYNLLTWTNNTSSSSSKPNRFASTQHEVSSSSSSSSGSVDPRRERAKQEDQRDAESALASAIDYGKAFGAEDHSGEDEVASSWQQSTDTTSDYWDPQSLLDFAVVDLDETVADAVTSWLAGHPRIQILSSNEESHSEIAGNPYQLIDEVQGIMSMHAQKRIIRGYRVDLDRDDEFDALRDFWPKTKLIVVLRHPIRWFEDYYNRYIQTSTNAMFHPNRLIGSCHQRQGQTICTEKADVAFPLLKLGKTMNSPTPRTLQIINENRMRQNLLGATIPLHPNPVFLVTWEQLTDTDPDRQAQLVDDLEYFLGIRSGIPFLQLPLDQEFLKMNTKNEDPHVHNIEICNGNFRPLRRALMDISRRSAQWIRDDFLASTTVTCSQMDWFSDNLNSWMHDPCASSGLGSSL